MSGGAQRTLLAAPVVAALVLIATWAPVASADCGAVEVRHPKHKVAPRPPLAIGDSSMLLALPALARVGYEANARGCRAYPEGLRLLRQRVRQHRLPHLVVIALGSDQQVTGGEINQALKILGPNRKLGLVTPRETGGGESNDAAVIRNAGQRNPERVKVLDWVRFAAGHDSWFQPDGLHLTFAGAKAFARLCKKLVPIAAPEPKPKPKRTS